MKDREYIPIVCSGCGAPLPTNLKCEYCGTRHERKQRYTGPDIPDNMGFVFRSMVNNSVISTNDVYSTCYIQYNNTTTGNWNVDGLSGSTDWRIR